MSPIIIYSIIGKLSEISIVLLISSISLELIAAGFSKKIFLLYFILLIKAFECISWCCHNKIFYIIIIKKIIFISIESLKPNFFKECDMFEEIQHKYIQNQIFLNIGNKIEREWFPAPIAEIS